MTRREDGATTVLVAAILLLAGVLALLSVDLLRILQAKSRAQTAADAAALAAAQELAVPRGRVPPDVAAGYAKLNGATLLACRCDPGTREAVVEVQTSVALVFLGGSRTVHALARAVVEAAFRGRASTMAANDSDGSNKDPPSPRAWGR
jgi:secretion/DNA translocation related TadE-like protein